MIFSISCIRNSEKGIPDLIKNDWIIVNNDIAKGRFLLVFDSLMIENLTYGDLPVSPYKISNDTLIIYSQDFDYNPLKASIKRIWRLKILKIDSNELLIRPALGGSEDTVYFHFKKIDQTKRNNLKIERLEFSYTGGYGYSKDIKIEKDSSLFHYGYSGFSKIKGLSSCKLPPDIYERLQRWVYSIDRDSFKINYPVPVTSIYYLFIKTKNDSIEIEGHTSIDSDSNMEYLFDFLMNLDYLVNLDSVQNDTIKFRYKRNSEWFK